MDVKQRITNIGDSTNGRQTKNFGVDGKERLV